MHRLKHHIVPAILACLTAFIILPSAVEARQLEAGQSINDLEWDVERIHAGIYWKKYLGDQLFDSKQSINLVEVYLDSTDAKLHISYEQGSLVKTSEFAERYNAIIALNGSYFDMEAGGTVTFLKVQGSTIIDGFSERQLYSENGGIAWNNSDHPEIISRPENGWRNSEMNNILAAGPLLIFNEEIRNFNNDSFNQNRHPRTAVALTKDNRLFLLTVDGRSFQSYGMTIPELAYFLKSAGAVDALNLDGGGSTAMWIKNMAETGIVNYPSDNLEFDHEGERSVSNALLLILNEQRIIDER